MLDNYHLRLLGMDDMRPWQEALKDYMIEKGHRMHKYEVIVYRREEGEAYIADVLELAGCMADGATYEEAPRNVQVVISEWIKTVRASGREIPVPKGRLVYT